MKTDVVTKLRLAAAGLSCTFGHIKHSGVTLTLTDTIFKMWGLLVSQGEGEMVTCWTVFSYTSLISISTQFYGQTS